MTERNLMDDLNALSAALNGAERHPCIHPGCEHTVEFDDEPRCFTHSPDEGSAVPGYSWKREHPDA